ncbi:hypothetical protein [Streptomyces rubellomurinus]|uniref:Uncharacterized protein n=1 Tax=Streptomyces sp. Y1 TaxID=3238634 RepID=A0AB39TYI8_9ACTN|nr:hypothetical protein [Streptomyces rubellomurinus]
MQFLLVQPVPQVLGGALPWVGDDAQGQALVEAAQCGAGVEFVGEASAADGVTVAVDGRGVDGEGPGAVAGVDREAGTGGAELAAVVVAAAAAPVDAASVVAGVR